MLYISMTLPLVINNSPKLLYMYYICTNKIAIANSEWASWFAFPHRNLTTNAVFASDNDRNCTIQLATSASDEWPAFVATVSGGSTGRSCIIKAPTPLSSFFCKCHVCHHAVIPGMIEMQTLTLKVSRFPMGYWRQFWIDYMVCSATRLSNFINTSRSFEKLEGCWFERNLFLISDAFQSKYEWNIYIALPCFDWKSILFSFAITALCTSVVVMQLSKVFGDMNSYDNDIDDGYKFAGWTFFHKRFRWYHTMDKQFTSVVFCGAYLIIHALT